MPVPPPNPLTKKLQYFAKNTRWTKGIGAELPDAYKKFWREWKIDRPAPVYYIPREGKYEKYKDGTIRPIQNVPIPLKYPKELDEGLWGGEAVVRGFLKVNKYRRRFVRYWVPELKKTVIYSEILDKHMKTTVTQRAMNLIHQHYGLDHYILATKACDLRSLLALTLKRNMLMSLYDKTLYPQNPVKREEVYEKYKKYLDGYTREDIVWYGHKYDDACKMLISLKKEDMHVVPLKVKFREELIKLLEDEKLEKAKVDAQESEPKSWLSKFNVFKSDKSKPSTE